MPTKSLADDAISDKLRRHLFVEAYIKQVERNPYIYLGHTAYIYNSIENALPYKTPYTTQWSEFQQLYNANQYYSAIDKLFGSGSPVGIEVGLGRGPISLSLDTKMALIGLTRRFWIGNDLTQSQVEQRLIELVRDTQAVRGVANVVYDGFLGKSSFAPYNLIASVATPYFVKPTDSPSTYLNTFSAELNALFQIKLETLSEQDRVGTLENWDAFRLLFSSVVGGGTQHKTVNADNLQDGLSVLPSDEVKSSTYRILENLDLSSDFVGLFRPNPVSENLTEEQRHSALVSEFDTIRIGLGGLEQIASASDPSTAKVMRIASNVISAYYFAQMATTAAGTMSSVAYGIGAVGAIAGVFSALSSGEPATDPLLLAIYDQQREILNRLSVIDLRLQALAAAVSSVSREVELLGSNQGRRFSRLADQLSIVQRTAAKNVYVQQATAETQLELPFLQAVEQFELELRANGRINWHSDDARRRIATMQVFALDTITKEPYVRSSDDADVNVVWSEIVERPWDWSKEAVDLTSTGVEFYGLRLLQTLFADSGDKQSILGSFGELEKIKIRDVPRSYNHDSMAEAAMHIAYVAGMGGDLAGANSFDLVQIREVIEDRSQYLRELVSLTPLRLAILKADLRHLNDDWIRAFTASFERARRADSSLANSPGLAGDSITSEILNKGLKEFLEAFRCLRGVSSFKCEERLSPYWTQAPIITVDIPAVRPLYALGLVEAKIDQSVFAAVDPSDVTGISIARNNLPGTVRACVPIIIHRNWSANIVRNYAAPDTRTTAYGYPLALNKFCFTRPEPPWYRDRIRALYQNGGDQALFQQTMRQLAFDLWEKGMSGEYSDLGDFGGYELVRKLSVSYAEDVLRKEISRIEEEVGDTLLSPGSKIVEVSGYLDKQLITFASQLVVTEPTCRTSVIDRFVGPLLPTSTFVDGDLPSLWIRRQLQDHRFESVQRYVAALSKIDFSDLAKFGDCFALSDSMEAAGNWIDFLDNASPQ